MRKKHLFIMLLVMILSVPLFAFSAGLVPCGGASETPCSLCHLYSLAQKIMDFLMWQAVPIIAIFAFSWAGFKILISGPNPGLRSEGFGIMKKTLVGIVIVFSSWIIINEMLLFFASPAGTTGAGTVLNNPWNAVNCSLPPAPETKGSAYDGPGAPTEQAQPRTILSAAGINAKENYCQYFGPPNQTTLCTTLVQLPQRAITGLINLREGCACEIYITGGTEVIGHVGHGPGIAKVDIRKNQTLDAYILSIGGTSQTTTLGPLYTVNGVTYLDEIGNEPHWHIAF